MKRTASYDLTPWVPEVGRSCSLAGTYRTKLTQISSPLRLQQVGRTNHG